jgi:hypothetical protein
MLNVEQGRERGCDDAGGRHCCVCFEEIQLQGGFMKKK